MSNLVERLRVRPDRRPVYNIDDADLDERKSGSTPPQQKIFRADVEKKDVMKELSPNKELILRVELSIKQKEYYKAILTRYYEILTRKGGTQKTSEKLHLLDNMMVKLKE